MSRSRSNGAGDGNSRTRPRPIIGPHPFNTPQNPQDSHQDTGNSRSDQLVPHPSREQNSSADANTKSTCHNTPSTSNNLVPPSLSHNLTPSSFTNPPFPPPRLLFSPPAPRTTYPRDDLINSWPYNQHQNPYTCTAAGVNPEYQILQPRAPTRFSGIFRNMDHENRFRAGYCSQLGRRGRGDKEEWGEEWDERV